MAYGPPESANLNLTLCSIPRTARCVRISKGQLRPVTVYHMSQLINASNSLVFERFNVPISDVAIESNRRSIPAGTLIMRVQNTLQ